LCCKALSQSYNLPTTNLTQLLAATAQQTALTPTVILIYASPDTSRNAVHRYTPRHLSDSTLSVLTAAHSLNNQSIVQTNTPPSCRILTLLPFRQLLLTILLWFHTDYIAHCKLHLMQQDNSSSCRLQSSFTQIPPLAVHKMYTMHVLLTTEMYRSQPQFPGMQPPTA
jgi:hypothetical protein